MRTLILSLVLVLISAEVFASIQDYQIIRLIAMDSECARQDLQRVKNEDGSVLFMAKCTNVSHYPDGLNVHCSDADNERSCKIMTESKQFNHLKLLQDN